MGGLRAWLDRRGARRADKRALRKERAANRRARGGDTSEIGYVGVGKGSKNKRGTAGTGGV